MQRRVIGSVHLVHSERDCRRDPQVRGMSPGDRQPRHRNYQVRGALGGRTRRAPRGVMLVGNEVCQHLSFDKAPHCLTH